MVATLLDEVIHAARVGLQEGARIGVHGSQFTIRDAPKLHGAEVFVDCQSRFAEDLAKLSASHMTQQIHLPQAILGHDVTLSFGQIVHGICSNVRYAPTIALYSHLFLKAGYDNVSVRL